MKIDYWLLALYRVVDKGVIKKILCRYIFWTDYTQETKRKDNNYLLAKRKLNMKKFNKYSKALEVVEGVDLSGNKLNSTYYNIPFSYYS